MTSENAVKGIEPRALLTCFFGESEKQFRFLEDKHGFSYFSGLAQYKNNYKIIVPYHGARVQTPFWAMARYEKDERAVEICYGDDHFVLEIFLYIDAVTRLSLKDMVTACHTSYPYDDAIAGLTEEKKIGGLLNALADILRRNAKPCLNPSDKLIERALTMRSKLTEQAVRAYYQKLRDEACERAAKAFTQKNYQLVVDLLKPFEHDLSKADQKKYMQALRQLMH